MSSNIFINLIFLILLISCGQEPGELAQVTFHFESSTAQKDWGAANPTASSDFDCFGVMVDYPEVNTGNSCIDFNHASIVTPDNLFGMVGTNQDIVAEVNIGLQRRFSVVGFNSTLANCPTAHSDLSQVSSGLSAPFLIGSTIVDVTSDTGSILIPASFTGSSEIKKCNGPLFGYSVQVPNKNLFVGTSDNYGGYSVDQGQAWTNFNAANSFSNATINSLGRNTSNGYILAGSNGNGIFRTTNGGSLWTTINTGLTETNANNVYFEAATGYFYAALGTGSTGEVALSTDQGGTWTATATGSAGLPGSVALLGVRASGSTIYVVPASSSNVYVSVNGGVSFAASAAITGNLNSINLNSDGRLIVGSTSNGVYISSDGGSSWGANYTTANGIVSNVVTEAVIDSFNRIILGTDGGISISNDNGANWINRTTADGLAYNSIEQIEVDADGVIYVACTDYGATGGICFSTDNGVSFTCKTMANGLPSNRVTSLLAFD